MRPQLPKRYSIVFMCFLGMVIAYSDRVNISIAAIDMQNSLGWSDTMKGLVLSSFFVGYIGFMAIGGVLANRFGAKRVLLAAVILWSLFTMLTPFAAAISGAVLIAARVVLGIGEAVAPPATFGLVAKWVPADERARAISFVSSGATIGALIALLTTGWVIVHFGWPMAFYSFGAVGFIWALAWYFIGADEPPQPATTPDGDAKRAPIPWRKIFASVNVWALFVTSFAVGWCLFVFLAWLPSYFYDTQGLSLVSSGVYAAAPWLAMSVCMILGGQIADALIKSGRPIIFVRKLMQTVGLGGASICVLMAGGAETLNSALILTIGALGLLALCYSGFTATVIDIAPDHSDVLWGVANTFGTMPGIVGVAITGWLVETTGTYTAAFTLTAAIGAVGTLTFLLLGTSRRVI